MTVLEQICDKKRAHVAAQKEQTPLEYLKEKIAQTSKPRGFLNHLRNKAPCAIIAEVKQASPSKGLLTKNFNPAEIAKTYEEAGAACISTLTDKPYFLGCDKDLTSVLSNTSLPVLRKDFMIDAYQIFESRALGADCILLIMAALTDKQAETFHDLAKDLEMDVLIEIHDNQELSRALKLNPKLIGINNRNLKTLDVDLQTSFSLVENIPDAVFKISESGISTAEEIRALQQLGFQGFLIGETLMRQKNIKKTLKTLLTQNTN